MPWDWWSGLPSDEHTQRFGDTLAEGQIPELSVLYNLLNREGITLRPEQQLRLSFSQRRSGAARAGIADILAGRLICAGGPS